RALLRQALDAVGAREPRVTGDEAEHRDQADPDPPAASVVGQRGTLEYVRAREQEGPEIAVHDRYAAEVVAGASEPTQGATRETVDQSATDSCAGSGAQRQGELTRGGARGEELRQRSQDPRDQDDEHEHTPGDRRTGPLRQAEVGADHALQEALLLRGPFFVPSFGPGPVPTPLGGAPPLPARRGRGRRN